MRPMSLEKTLRRAIEAGKRAVLQDLDSAAIATGSENAFGDSTLVLDRKAEDAIISTLELSDTSFAIMSEEIGVILPDGRPEFMALIDPVDGSTNLKRGVPLCSIGIAVVPYGETLTTDDIELSIIESIFTDEVYIARKGHGVTRNGRAVRPSQLRDPETAIISYDTKKEWSGGFDQSSYRVMKGVYDIRRTGSNLLDLCWTAAGGLDAMVDLRNRLPIIHASGTHMVLEAGGVVLNADGKPWKLSIDFKRPMSFVAAGTPELAEKLVAFFRGRHI